jgi:hypothetical protein
MGHFIPSLKVSSRRARVVVGLLLSMSVSVAAAAPRPGPVTGVIDAIRYEGDQYFVFGWACQQGNRGSIDVHLYARHAAGAGGSFVLGGRADIANEPAVDRECRDGRGQAPIQDRAAQPAPAHLPTHEPLRTRHCGRRQCRKRRDRRVGTLAVSRPQMATRSADARLHRRPTGCGVRHQKGVVRTDRHSGCGCAGVSRRQRHGPPDRVALRHAREPWTHARDRKAQLPSRLHLTQGRQSRGFRRLHMAHPVLRRRRAADRCARPHGVSWLGAPRHVRVKDRHAELLVQRQHFSDVGGRRLSFRLVQAPRELPREPSRQICAEPRAAGLQRRHQHSQGRQLVLLDSLRLGVAAALRRRQGAVSRPRRDLPDAHRERPRSVVMARLGRPGFHRDVRQPLSRGGGPSARACVRAGALPRLRERHQFPPGFAAVHRDAVEPGLGRLRPAGCVFHDVEGFHPRSKPRLAITLNQMLRREPAGNWSYGYFSLIDPGAKDASFGTITERPYLYYVRFDNDHPPYQRVLFRQRVKLDWLLRAAEGTQAAHASTEGTHQIVSQATGLCFNIRGNTNNSGEAIIPYPCGGVTNMEFNFVDQGGGFYSIHTVNGTQDLCLNISTAASSPGDGKKFGGPGNLIQWSCSGSSLSDNELFKLVDLGAGRQQIRVKNSGLCLEDPGIGGTVRQNVCSSSPNQIFTLTESRPE